MFGMLILSGRMVQTVSATGSVSAASAALVHPGISGISEKGGRRRKSRSCENGV